MTVPVNVRVVSDRQLSDAASRYGALVALNHAVHVVETDISPESFDPMAVELEINGDVLVARMAAIMGSGAMLEHSAHSPSVDDDIQSMYFAVRPVREAARRSEWEVGEIVYYGDGSIDKFNEAARGVARYIFD